jgi:hypothetical protein
MVQGHEVMHVCGSFMASMRSTAPGLVQRSTWPLTVGQTGSMSSKIRRRAKRGWMKNVHHHHTLPRYCCCGCCSGWMLLCALFCSIKLYPLVHITSRMLFLFWDFWDLGFKTWTDRQTPPLLLLYIRFLTSTNFSINLQSQGQLKM